MLPSRRIFHLLPLAILFFLSRSPIATNGQELILDAARFASSVEVANVVTDRTSQCNVAANCLPYDAVDQRRVVRADIVIANIGDIASQLSANTNNAFLTTSPCDTKTKAMRNILQLQLTDPSEFNIYATVRRNLCLYDGETSPLYTGSAAAAAAFYTCNTSTSSGLFQGLSVGWQVTYPKELDCFGIDVTDLLPGQYKLIATFNNPLIFPDLNTTNNLVSTLFTISDAVCSPVPKYSNASTSFTWDDPIANSHNSTAFSLTQVQISSLKYFCARSTSVWLSPRGFISFINPANEDTFINSESNLFNQTMAPYWMQEWEPSTNVTGSGMYWSLTGSVGQRTLTVSWIGLVGQSQADKLSDAAQSFQLAYFEATQVIEFRYQKVVVNTEAAFTNGAAQTIAITGPNRVLYPSHTLLIAHKVTGSVSDATAIRFTPQPSGGTAGRPTAYTTGPYNGFSTLPINFNALNSTGGSTSVTKYTWNFGDGHYPARILPGNVNYTYPSAGDFVATLKVSNGVDESNDTTVAVTANPVPGDGGPVQPTDDGGDGNTIAIVAGVVIPIVVILAILVCIVAVFLIYYNRGIVPSGGEWWNEDPEYVNLPHTWNGAEEPPSSSGK